MEAQTSQHVRPQSPVASAIAAMQARTWTADQVRDLLGRLLDAAGLDYDQRVEVLGGALVSEAVRPFWEAGHTAAESHDLLCRRDPELAEVVEALSPALLGRAEAKDEAKAAIGMVEALFAS